MHVFSKVIYIRLFGNPITLNVKKKNRSSILCVLFIELMKQKQSQRKKIEARAYH